MNPRGWRLFRRENCLSYAIYDREAGVGALIDPDQTAMDEYRSLLSELGVRLAYAFDTGVCEEHRSAAGLLRAELGGDVLGLPSGRALADGERLELGSLRLRVIDSHRLIAEEGVGPSLLLEGADIPTVAFTGRLVPIGRMPALKVENLSPGTLLCPSWVSDEILFSTLETENARAKPEFDGNQGPPATAITIEKYQNRLARPKATDLFVDVREPSEYWEAHIPGARNIPLSELGRHLSEFRGHERVYLSCLSGRRSSAAARTLAYVGLGNVVNVLGGFQAWKGAGYDIEKGFN